MAKSVNVTAVAASVAALALTAAAVPAQAKFYTVAFSGIWNPSAAFTAYSAPNESFAFSFRVQSTFLADYYDQAPDIAATTQFTAYSYKLNGVLVPGAPDDIAFFSNAYGGGLALGYYDYSVEFSGTTLANIDTVNPDATLILGKYSLMAYLQQQGTGDVVALTDVPSTGSVVPEPAAWAMMLVGVAGVGAVARRRRGLPLAA